MLAQANGSAAFAPVANARVQSICRPQACKSKTARLENIAMICIESERIPAHYSVRVRKQWARHLLRLLPLSPHGIAKAEVIVNVSEPTVRHRPDDEPIVTPLIGQHELQRSLGRIVRRRSGWSVDAQNISLTFETADGRVDALSNVSLQIAERRIRFLHRPVRLRQDHDAAGDRRSAAALLGHAAGQRHERGTGAAGAQLWLCVPGAGACFRGARSRRI